MLRSDGGRSFFGGSMDVSVEIEGSVWELGGCEVPSHGLRLVVSILSTL